MAETSGTIEPTTFEEAMEALRVAEAQLKAAHAERAALHNDFHERVRDFAHDIKSALGGVVGYSQLLKNDSLDAEKSLKYADAIHRSALRVVDICNAMVEREMDIAGTAKSVAGDCR